MLQSTNEMGMDPFVVFPAEWAAAGFEIHATPRTLHSHLVNGVDTLSIRTAGPLGGINCYRAS